MDDNLSMQKAWGGHVTRLIFGANNPIFRTAETRPVRFCTRAGCIKAWQVTPKRGAVRVTWLI